MDQIDNKEIAFVFPGQGSQYIKMGKDFFDNFSEYKIIIEEASDTLKIDMKKLIFGDDENMLNLTENTQPAILTVSIAILSIIKNEFEINVSTASGHSLGEYSANVFAGIIKFKNALLITKKRGELMQSACPVGFGKMAAIIGLPPEIIEETVNQINYKYSGTYNDDKDNSDNINNNNNIDTDKITKGTVFVANYNSPNQSVISGKAEYVEKACDLLKEKGAKKIVYLPVSAPFHTPYMQDAAKGLEDFINKDWFNDSINGADIFSNVDGLNYSKKNDAINYLLRQITSPVRWVDCIINMKKIKNIKVFIEIGPSNVLTGLIKRIDKEAVSYSVNSVESFKELGKIISKFTKN
ncbi:MAG: ACP S-malonyltransferase [Candidatus Acididesulfobacter diazotrophicus]|jgi:[acyl-carrier-protein] S-malonyltransferase|uniref:Malonyl CoA-acyl carrier protein transacylase n=1 Tax=Candidatus Acididesulfobacter diazotrophicus TaxID=2597226 RepID=A0A519BMM0_9DELT|nr:MAG: ACP S-malonyltransferase [Candidatus Acididesulfobacter diazotrophicus]